MKVKLPVCVSIGKLIRSAPASSLISCLLALAFHCNTTQDLPGPSEGWDLKITWSEMDMNNVSTLTDEDKGSVIEVALSGEKRDSLRLRGKIEEWGWALARVDVTLDLSYTDSIVFHVEPGALDYLTFGISDDRKIQYVLRISLNGGGRERIAVSLSDFCKTIYPDPDAPGDEPIDLSKITGLQFQPEEPDSFDLAIGPLTFVGGKEPVMIKSDAPLDFSDFDALPELSVSGNRIVDENGNAVVLKGLCSGDPAKMIPSNQWNEDYFKEASLWEAEIFRIPVSQWSYHSMGHGRIFTNLDRAVYWCKKYGMYAVIEWHSCGNIVQGIFNDPPEGFETTMPETVDFWRMVSLRYKNEPTAAFYEIFNEPAAMEWKGGALSWKEWRDKADEIIDTIYAYNPGAIPLVAGLDWAYDLQGYASEPLRNTGFVFSVHPYPGRTGQPWEDHWESDFGYLAADYPMMFTEIGFDPQDTIVPHVYKGTVDYGRRIIDFADARGISWIAWVFYTGSGWPMPLFEDWESFTPTVSGAFFKEELKK